MYVLMFLSKSSGAKLGPLKGTYVFIYTEIDRLKQANLCTAFYARFVVK